MWGGYNNVAIRVDGVSEDDAGYSTTVPGRPRPGVHHRRRLGLGKPFLLYETPQAPHWVDVTNPDGTTSKPAVPEAKYADARTLARCSASRSQTARDKPPTCATMNLTAAQGQQMCESQLRAIMTADDEFDATMQLLSIVACSPTRW